MAALLKGVHVSDVPNLDQVADNVALSLSSSLTSFSNNIGLDLHTASFKKTPRFMVIGHRGNGMNNMESSDPRMKGVKENSILSFNSASKFPIDFVEFDVQVTKDNYPVIFHDNFIFSEENDTIVEKRVTELSLSEFLSYGLQKETGKTGKKLVKKNKQGKILKWNVETDDSVCTLQDVFQKVEPKLGFNIELKFDDNIVYHQDYLIHVLRSILQVIDEFGKDRPIIFSSFQPDAAQLIRKLQNAYPVYFLTNGGTEIYSDVRRNSLEEAIKLCLEGGLEGIVSEVKGVFRNPGAVGKIKDSNLSLLTYGKLNNIPEAVYMEYMMGVEGVIVDFVEEITGAVNDMILIKSEESKPAQFSQKDLAFLFKLIPELMI